MPTVPVDVGIVQELLAGRDELVRAITGGIASGNWDPVMHAFDGLLSAITHLEESLGPAEAA